MTPVDVPALNRRAREWSPEALLGWAYDELGDDIHLASSFGAEDVALIDMMVKLRPKARVFCLDTGRLPQATYDVIAEVRRKYGIEIDVYFPDTRSTEEMVHLRGPNLFYESVENRKLCCGVRKVEPLRRALTGHRAWVTGLRREQAATRAFIERLEVDEDHGGIYKLNPLAAWTTEQVWVYIHHNGVPYNRLHDAGYPSIGCEPCTRAVAPGEDIRAGRWWWEQPEQRECGLHLPDPQPKS